MKLVLDRKIRGGNQQSPLAQLIVSEMNGGDEDRPNELTNRFWEIGSEIFGGWLIQATLDACGEKSEIIGTGINLKYGPRHANSCRIDRRYLYYRNFAKSPLGAVLTKLGELHTAKLIKMPWQEFFTFNERPRRRIHRYQTFNHIICPGEYFKIPRNFKGMVLSGGIVKTGQHYLHGLVLPENMIAAYSAALNKQFSNFERQRKTSRFFSFNKRASNVPSQNNSGV